MKIKFSKILSFIILAQFILFSCSSLPDKQTSSITGKMVGSAGKKITLEKLSVDDLLVIDSTMVNNKDEFSFSVNPEETTFCLLRFEDGNFITLVLNPHDHLEINAVADSFPPHYRVAGNEDSRILQHYYTETFQRQMTFDQLREEFFSSTQLAGFYQIKERIDQELKKLISDQRNFTIQTIEKNPGSLASLLLLNQRFANLMMIDREKDFQWFELLDSTLLTKYPQNTHVLEHHRRVADFRKQLAEQEMIAERLSPGRQIPDIALNDVSGKTRKISDFRGKPVVLYFWVSWSPPCRAANHQLKELYTAWHPKGFEIFAISLDHQQRFWADAIKVDELPWINVSDLKGMSSPVVDLFNLPQELPFYFLVDEEGKIEAKSNKFSEISKAVAGRFER